MSDTSADSYVPRPSLSGPRAQPQSFSSRELGTRIRLLQQRNPYMANRPDVLEMMAASDMDSPRLAASASSGAGNLESRFLTSCSATGR